MTNKLTKSTGFALGLGSKLGTKSQAILEILSLGKPKNQMDIEMMLGYRVTETLARLQENLFLKKSTYGSATGCYEITGNGRIAIGQKLALPPPAYTPFINSTMTEIYNPDIHNTARIGVARA